MPELWQFEETPIPKLPVDIYDAGMYLLAGEQNRRYVNIYNDPVNTLDRDELVQLNVLRQLLWSILTDEQKATWYWYGFAEIREWRSRMREYRFMDPHEPTGFFRVHSRGGGGLASIIPWEDGYAQTGLCCYQPAKKYNIEDTISNILALRTESFDFECAACTNQPVETAFNKTYPELNVQRIKSAPTDAYEKWRSCRR